MILPRLSQSLKEQDWTAISITIEFVLLVVGVFLSIQVDAFNSALASPQTLPAYRLTALA